MKASLRIVLVIIFVAAVAGGVWFVRNRNATAQSASDSTGTYTQVVQAERGSLSAAISVVGQLEAVQQADMAFEKLTNTTALQSTKVAAGNTVKAGDVLATVDPVEYQQAVDQARSDLQSAQETLADLQTPATELEISQADLAVAQAQQQVEQAKADLEDLQTPASTTLVQLQNGVTNAQAALDLAQLNQALAASGATVKAVRNYRYTVAWHERKIDELQQLVAAGKANKEQTDQVATEQDDLGEAQADLAAAEAQDSLAQQNAAASVTAARASLVDAQQALADAQKGGDELELAKTKLAIVKAEASLIKAKEVRAKLDEGADATKLAVAQAAVDKNILAVADAEAALAATSLVAPFDGTILQVNASQGDLVSSNSTILTIADMSKLQVLASVDETTIQDVTAGQSAQVTFDALPGKTLSGTVGDVPLQGTLQGDIMVYEVPVSLAGTEGLTLLAGMTADVTISTGDVEDALLVPAMALIKSNGMYQVLVADPANPDAEPQAVPVQTGLSNGTYTQITAGLNEGDQVVVELSSDSSSNLFGFPGGGMMIMDGGRPPDIPAQRQGSSSSSSGQGR